MKTVLTNIISERAKLVNHVIKEPCNQQILAISTLTLVMRRGKHTLVMIGGGGLKVPPLFLFVKTIEKEIRLGTVLKKQFFDW